MIIRKNIAAAAAAGTYFPLQGSQYEYLPFNAMVEFAILAGTALGAGMGSLLALLVIVGVLLLGIFRNR